MITVKIHIPIPNQEKFIQTCNEQSIKAQLTSITDISYCYDVLFKDQYDVYKLFFLGWSFGINLSKQILTEK